MAQSRFTRIDLVVTDEPDGGMRCCVRPAGRKYRHDLMLVKKVAKLGISTGDIPTNTLRAFREHLTDIDDFSWFVEHVANTAFQLGLETQKKK